jgi:hypothetical protein
LASGLVVGGIQDEGRCVLAEVALLGVWGRLLRVSLGRLWCVGAGDFFTTEAQRPRDVAEIGAVCWVVFCDYVVISCQALSFPEIASSLCF